MLRREMQATVDCSGGWSSYVAPSTSLRAPIADALLFLSCSTLRKLLQCLPRLLLVSDGMPLLESTLDS